MDGYGQELLRIVKSEELSYESTFLPINQKFGRDLTAWLKIMQSCQTCN